MRLHSEKTEQLQLWNQHLRAFSQFCEESTKCAQSDTAISRSLSGITCGVKDIIDVAGLPTRNGSAACQNSPPAKDDAVVVSALRRAGACIVGKTVTTEFAFTDATDCRNPYDLTRSPGGSSSGSGAAVAAGMVDIALGTQTAGSLCRPAAYCGAVGFKPSFGALSMQGITPLAPSFDTLGIIARSVDRAGRAFEAMHSAKDGVDAKPPSDYTAACLLLDTKTEPAPETGEAFRESAATLAQITARVVDSEIDIDASAIVLDHRTVMNREAFVAHGHLLNDQTRTQIGPKFLAGLEAGSRVTKSALSDAAERLAQAKSAFWQCVADFDVILTLPVPDGAPLLGRTTGFQDWLTPWTVFGGPLISFPWGLDTLGRPRSVMLAGHPGTEATLLGVAAALERKAPVLPSPQLRE